ncbi:MAG: pantoate--beta-alanine ligase [Saprospiraceae bacterium]|nr:pantoate--beta-alanine ligase [Saprospiraceae bacterium]
MQVFTQKEEIKSFTADQRKRNHSIAFVPTMGALHSGHISLIQIAKANADIGICSIFVNPTQFNNPQDLQNYPRMVDRDIKMLEERGCDAVFVPAVEVVYPPGLDTGIELDLGTLDKVMEGKFRPGHFKGMLQVVKRLLDLVEPDLLIMGQKDFQQYTLVRHMINQLNLPVRLIIGATLREADGLAMSSRNLRLSPEMRKNAIAIYKNLTYLKENLYKTKLDLLISHAFMDLEKSGLQTEYLEIVDDQSLESVMDPKKHENLVACIAAWAGNVRLIDNLCIKGSCD